MNKNNPVTKAEATVENASNKLLQIEAYMEDTRKDRHEATQELRNKLQQIEQPYNSQIASYEDKHYKARLVLKAANEQLENVKAQELILEAKKLKYFNCDSFNTYLVANKVRENPSCNIKEQLPNGLVVFQHKQSYGEFNSYFVMNGTRLVGYWFKQQPRHRGESYTSWAWSKVNRLTYKNALRGQTAKDFIASFAKVRKPHKLAVIGIAKNVKVLQATCDYSIEQAAPYYPKHEEW